MSYANRSHNMEHTSRRSRPSHVCDAFEQLTGGEKLSKTDADHQFHPMQKSRSSDYSTIRTCASPPDNFNTALRTRSRPPTDHNHRSHEPQYHSDGNHSFKKRQPSNNSSDYYDGPSAYYDDNTHQDGMYRQAPSHRQSPMLRSGMLKADHRPQYQHPGNKYEDYEEYASPSSLLRNEGAGTDDRIRKEVRVTRDRNGRPQLERGGTINGRDSSMSKRDKLAVGFFKYVVGDY